MNIHELLRGIADRVSASASVKTVYGDPVVHGDRTVLPAAEIRYAFGAGGGGKGDEPGDRGGGGGGGRVSARPVGALEITPRGTRFVASKTGAKWERRWHSGLSWALCSRPHPGGSASRC